MTPPVVRTYRSAIREEQARRTRQALLDAALRSFVERGYVATTVARIAAAAGVNVDTIYASIGTKPAVFRLLLETALSGTTEAVPAEERDYVRRIRQAPTASGKLEIYASAVRAINERLAPLHQVMTVAAAHAAELETMRHEIGERRAANMLLFAQDLAATRELAPGTSIQMVADVVWATSGPDFFTLLVGGRGWTAEAYQAWLAASWRRLFLAG